MSEDLINKKEKLLFEYAIADKEVFVRCFRILKPSYFEAPLNRVVEFVMDFFHKYHDTPNLDVIEAETGIMLEGHVIDQTDIRYLLDEIEAHCREQAMIQAILKSVDLVQDQKVNEVSELVRNALLVRLDDSIGIDLYENPEERITNTNLVMDERGTGIEALDDYINKVRRGELGIVYGTSSAGKSVVLGNITAKMARQQLDVAVVSLELGDTLYAKRMDTIATGFDISAHESLAPEIAAALKEMAETSGRITIKKLPVGSTVADVRAYLMEYHLKHNKYPDVLVVDYLALMDAVTNHGRGAFEEQKEIAFGLKQLVEDIDAYGFSAGQMSRDANDVVKVHAGHVSGGMSVINASDWSVALVASEQDIDNNQMQVVQLKLRNGAKISSPITLYRDPKSLRVDGKPFTEDQKKFKTPVSQKGEKAEDLDKAKGKDKLARALKKR